MSDAAVAGTPAPSPDVQSEIPNEEIEALVAEETAESSAEPKAAPIKEEKKETAKKRKFNLKVDGREEELELDLDNEEEVKKHLQMSRAAHKRMQEAAEYRKNVAQFFELLKTDPVKVLSDPSIGVDVKKMAEMVLNNEVEELKKSPEQREKDRLAKELEEIKDKYKKEEEARKSAEFQRLQEQAAVQLDQDMTSALETSGLPKSPRTVKAMAEYMMLAMQNDLDISAKELVPLVKKQILGEFKEMIGLLPDEALEEFLGKDNISRVRKRTLQRIKQVAQSPEQIKPTGEDAKKKKEEPKKIAFKDFFKPF